MADTESKRWRAEMADKTTRVVEAHGFRVDEPAKAAACQRTGATG
jgi:hypothetical protein